MTELCSYSQYDVHQMSERRVKCAIQHPTEALPLFCGETEEERWIRASRMISVFAIVSTGPFLSPPLTAVENEMRVGERHLTSATAIAFLSFVTNPRIKVSGAIPIGDV